MVMPVEPVPTQNISPAALSDRITKIIDLIPDTYGKKLERDRMIRRLLNRKEVIARQVYPSMVIRVWNTVITTLIPLSAINESWTHEIGLLLDLNEEI
jgi:hypothetical protein